MYKSLSGFKKNAQLPCLIETFTKGEIFHERGLTELELSRTMVKDLKKRGMKYLGPITMYSYLQTVGVINSHEEDCFLY